MKSRRKQSTRAPRLDPEKSGRERRPCEISNWTGSGERADWLWCAAIFAVAFAVRLVHLLQIESIPLFYHLAGDGHTYDEWAQALAAGDWIGNEIFYQAPLYPYFLGAVQFVLGHNLWLIRLIQIVLGSLACSLIFLTGRKLFSHRAGIAAGLILATYAPAVFFDALIEKSILDLFFLTLLLFLLVHAMEKPGWTQWLAAGAVLGLLGLSRENALVAAAIVPLWIGFYFLRVQTTTRLAWVGLFLAGLLLVLLPVGVRNYAVGGEFKLTTSQFGPNFFIGNNPAADGTYGSIRKLIGEVQLEGGDARRLAERDAGRSLSAGEVSDYWIERSLDYIREEPRAWLGLLGKKWLMVWNVREVEDSDDFYIYRQWSWVLALLSRLNHFGILAPLAMAGIWLTRSHWRRLSLLYALILALALSVAIFYVFGRYRFPLVPLLALFAGAAAANLIDSFRKRDWRSAWTAVGITLAGALVVNWPLYAHSGPGATGYINLSNGYYKQGRVSEATVTALRAIELEPDHCAAHYNLGNLYAGQGKFDAAGRHFQESLRLCPNYAEVHANYGQWLAEQGDVPGGISYFRKAIELNPTISRAHFNLGVALAKLGRLEEAVGPLREAARLDPVSPEASYYLGSVYAAQSRYPQAAEAFYQAVRIRRDFAPAHQSLAEVLRLLGKKEEAMHHYQEALRLMKQRGVR